MYRIIFDLHNLKCVLIMTKVLLLQYLTGDILSQISYRLMAFDDKFMDGAPLVDVTWHPYKLLGDELDLWDR